MSNLYIELHNLEKLRFLRNLSKDDFITFFTTPKEMSQSGAKVWIDKEYDIIKNWCNGMVKSKSDSTSQLYNSNKSCRRLFATSKVSFQSMPRRVRAFLARDNYIDIDIVNSAPNIIYWVATEKMNISPDKIDKVEEYSKNPKTVRANNCMEKNDFYKYFFDENCKGNSKFTRALAQQCKLIQNTAWDLCLTVPTDIYSEYSNPKGKYLSNVYFHYEREFLEIAIKSAGQENIGSPIHDGFLLKKNVNANDFITDIDLVLPEGIKFIVKDFDEDYPILKKSYQQFLNESPEEPEMGVDFQNIDDEFMLKHFFILQNNKVRVDKDNNIYVKHRYCWKTDDKNIGIYNLARQTVFDLENDVGFEYISPKDLKVFKKYRNHNTLMSLVNKIKLTISFEVEEFIEEQGNYWYFTNGYYNFDTYTFHNSFDKYNLWNFDYDFEPEHSFEGFNFDKIAKDCLGNNNYPLFLKYLLCAINGKNIKKILYMIGKGNNGKTTLVDTLRCALKPISHVVNGDIFAFDLSVNKPRADLILLKNKRLVFTSEPPESDLKTSTIKALSGGDNIICRKLHSNDSIEFKNQFLFLVASNNAPNLESIDEAVLNRYLFMEMKSRYVPNPRPNSDVDKKCKPIYLTDTYQKSQSIGIIHWLIQANKDYRSKLDSTDWTTPETVILNEQMAEENSEAKAWFEENTIDSVGATVILSDLYKHFKFETNSYITINKFNKDIGRFYKVKKGSTGNQKNRKIVENKKFIPKEEEIIE